MKPLTPGGISLLLASLASQKMVTASNQPTFSRTKHKNCEYQDHKQGVQHVPVGREGVGERDSNITESQPDYLVYL